MPRRHALAALSATLLLVLSGVATAQPDIPPSHKDLENGRPWTYQFGKMVLALALLMVVALVLGYLVKARDFRANQRRGGAK